MRRLRYALSLAITLGCATSAVAQDATAGRVAASAAGQAGVRKTRDQTVAGTVPTARINSRLQTRVQSRIRNRIDRFYDPQANAVSPFRVAGEQAREAKERPR